MLECSLVLLLCRSFLDSHVVKISLVQLPAMYRRHDLARVLVFCLLITLLRNVPYALGVVLC